MRFRLRYLHHDLELVEGEFVVGRNASCQLSLDDPLVSRRHAVLRVTSSVVTVEDLQSRNGVLVNGQRISGSVVLAPGDRLLIGSQEMTLLVVDDPGRGRLNMTLPKFPPADPVTLAPGKADDAQHRTTPISAVSDPASNLVARIHSSTTEPGRDSTPSSPTLAIAGRVGSTPGTPLRNIATAPSSRDPSPAPRSPTASGSGPAAAVPSSGGASGSGPAGTESSGPASRHPPRLGDGPSEPLDYEPTMVRRADAFSLLAGVAEKALAMGRAVEAERILASPLGDVIEASRAGKRVIPSLVDQAARFSAKLATATGKGAWADYVIELYSAQKRPCPAPVIDELYNALRRVTAIDLQRLREYIEDLRTRLHTFGPAERFLFQRIEGLERLAALR